MERFQSPVAPVYLVHVHLHTRFPGEVCDLFPTGHARLSVELALVDGHAHLLQGLAVTGEMGGHGTNEHAVQVEDVRLRMRVHAPVLPAPRQFSTARSASRIRRSSGITKASQSGAKGMGVSRALTRLMGASR